MGLLSIAQITCLPGLIIARLIKLEGGFIQKISFVFGFSLTFNYFVGFLLTILHIYIQYVVIGIAILEVAWVIWLYRKALKVNLEKAFEVFWIKFNDAIRLLLGRREDDTQKHGLADILITLTRLIFFVLAVVSLIWIIRILISSIGTIFNAWDAVISWNKMASFWATNQVPQHTYRYPQLMPINWSVTYVMIGTISIQFFAKAIMPLFLFFILLMIFDLALESKSMGIFLSVVITQYAMKHFLGGVIADGFADVPVAFFSFLSIYILLKSKESADRASLQKSLLMGAIFAGAAGITKQTGLYMLAAYPVLAFFIILWRKKEFTAREKWVQLLLMLGIIILIAAPWYIYKQITFAQGLDAPETKLVSNVTAEAFNTDNLFVRVWLALQSMGRYLYVFLISIPLIILGDRKLRAITGVMVVPFVLLWAAFLSYGGRNLAIALPFLGLVVGAGLGKLFELIVKGLVKIKVGKIPSYVLLLCTVPLVVGAGFLLNDQKLEARQTDLLKQLFSPTLNQKLYSFFETNPAEGKVLTNYPVSLLPGFEDLQESFWYNDFNVFLDELTHADIKYLLIPGYALDDIQAYISEHVAVGDIRLEFEDSSWVYYQFCTLLK